MGRVSIQSSGCKAQIDPLGAELRSWRVGDRELIWQGDPSCWTGSAPILFPVVGRCTGGQIRVDGKTYPMPVHGFASTSRFAVEHSGESEAVLSLTDTEETRRHYPFAFRLTVTFTIAESALTVRLGVANTDERPMPYAAGLHPGFAWPARATGDAAGAAVRFSDVEDASVPVITPGGFFAPERRSITLEGRTMPLTRANLGKEALCFLDARSDAATFMPGDGSALEVCNENLPHFAVWTKGEAAFLSIESWTGHGDVAGYAGAFAERPSMRILAPGEEAGHCARYTFRETA